MNIQSLPRIDRKPQLTNAESGHRFNKACQVEDRVLSAFDSFSSQLVAMDNSESDFNPHLGGVVVVNQYLDQGADTASKVSSASIAFNKESGEVESFKVITDDLNSVSYEYQHDDEFRSSNPTFTSVVNGVTSVFDLNPSSGLITSFE